MSMTGAQVVGERVRREKCIKGMNNQMQPREGRELAILEGDIYAYS